MIANPVVLSIEVGGRGNSGKSEFCGKTDFSWVMFCLLGLEGMWYAYGMRQGYA